MKLGILAIALSSLMLIACQGPRFDEFVPVEPGDLPQHLKDGVLIRKEITVGRGAARFRIGDEQSLQLLRLRVNAEILPLNIVLVVTVTFRDITQAYVLEDEPEADGWMGIRSRSLAWPRENTVLPAGEEIWVGVTAYSWSKLDFLDHPARRRVVGQTYRPDLPAVPHDRETQVPNPHTVIELIGVPSVEGL